MASARNKPNRRSSNKSDHATNSRNDQSNKAIFRDAINKGSIEGSRDLLFGIDPTGSILHKDAYEQIKVHLVNTKFYFESAAMSIATIIDYMEKVQRYDQEQKSIRNDELQRNQNQSGNTKKQSNLNQF